jgi:hypothetical protein
MIRLVTDVWTGTRLALFSLVSLSTLGCASLPLSSLQDGAGSLGSCSIHTSLGCASQALGGCAIPLDTWNSGDWKDYARCLGEKSRDCAVTGLARCSITAMTRAMGGRGPIISGGVGCSSEPMQAKIHACVSDTTIETEEEAIEAVAACQRRVCLKGE